MSIVTDFVEKNADLLQGKLLNNPALGKSLIECLAAIDFYANENKVEFSKEEAASVVEQGVLQQLDKEERKAQEAERVIAQIAQKVEDEAAANQNVAPVVQSNVFITEVEHIKLVTALVTYLNRSNINYNLFYVDNDDRFYFIFDDEIQFLPLTIELPTGQKYTILSEFESNLLQQKTISGSSEAANKVWASKMLGVHFVNSFNKSSDLLIANFMLYLNKDNIFYEIYENTDLDLIFFVFQEPYLGQSDISDQQTQLLYYYENIELYINFAKTKQKPSIILLDKNATLEAYLNKLTAPKQSVSQGSLSPTFAPTASTDNKTTNLNETEQQDLHRIQSILSDEEIQQLEAISEIQDEDLENLDDLLDI